MLVIGREGRVKNWSKLPTWERGVSKIQENCRNCLYMVPYVMMPSGIYWIHASFFFCPYVCFFLNVSLQKNLPSNNLVTLVVVSPYSEGHSFYSDGTSPGSLYAQISVDSPLALSKKRNIKKIPELVIPE